MRYNEHDHTLMDTHARSDGQRKLMRCACGARIYAKHKSEHKAECAARFPQPRTRTEAYKAKRKSQTLGMEPSEQQREEQRGAPTILDPKFWTPRQKRLFAIMDDILSEIQLEASKGRWINT